MRDTYTGLIAKAHKATQTDPNDTNLASYLVGAINQTYRQIVSELDLYNLRLSGSDETVADQQFYWNPDKHVKFHDVYVISSGGIRYDLKIVEDESLWNKLNSLNSPSSGVPTHVFPRAFDFGIFPTPASAGDDIYYSFTPVYPDMSHADYTTGTITVTNGDATVTGAGVTFNSSMVGRWLQITTADNPDRNIWYKIAAYTDATHLELHKPFEGTTAAGVAYLIGETPQLPPEAHKLLYYGAAMLYYIEKRTDANKAQTWSNMFWTGEPKNDDRSVKDKRDGLLGLKNRYAARGSMTGLVERISGTDRLTLEDHIWGVTIS